MITALLWVSLALIVYVYVCYPLLIAILVIGKPCPIAPEIPDGAWPRIAVLIPAYNEERWIARKIENTLALDYPAAKLRIVVASDGSTDRTAEIASGYAARGVEQIEFAGRLGKAEVLNRVIPQLVEEIVLLTDANALLDPSAARSLVRHFADPLTGAVAGRRICATQRSSASSMGEGLYWRYESWIKSNESRVHSATCADGQIYAVRRAAVARVPKGGEDFLIPMTMVSHGFRFVFEPEAIAVVPAAAGLAAEFRRKVRSHVSFLLNAWLLRRLLIPWRSPVCWQLFSHHILRMAVPPAMVVAFIASETLAGAGSLYGALFIAQAAFYLLATVGFPLAYLGRRPKLFYVPFYFVFAQMALAVAWWRWARGRHEFVWQRTERLLDPS
jgi:biofilm PGA synthesis N-glycosyltransferase PgaC